MNLKNNYPLIIVILALILIITGYMVISNVNGSSEITIEGSTSMYPVALALSKAYMDKNPGVHITVSGGDSDAGIKNVHNKQVDIGMSSRNLTNSEAQGLSQYIIGKDAIGVILNNENPVNSISTNELKNIYNGQTTNWADIGGNNSNITPVIREKGSGTRYDFEMYIMGGDDYTTNVVVATSTYAALQTVAVSPNTIGYISENSMNSEVKLLKVNNISLIPETVDNGTYPLTRSMLFLVQGNATGNIKDFIDFSLSPEGQNIIKNVEYGSQSNQTTSETGIGSSGG